MMMLFEVRIWKDGKWWLAELPIADLATQGHSRRDALRMLQDAVEALVNQRGFKARVHELPGKTYAVDASDLGMLVALILRRQRERHGLSLADAAKALGQASRNSFARYEQGRAVPSLDKLAELLNAIAPDMPIVIAARPAES